MRTEYDDLSKGKFRVRGLPRIKNEIELWLPEGYEPKVLGKRIITVEKSKEVGG